VGSWRGMSCSQNLLARARRGRRPGGGVWSKRYFQPGPRCLTRYTNFSLSVFYAAHRHLNCIKYATSRDGSVLCTGRHVNPGPRVRLTSLMPGLVATSGSFGQRPLTVTDGRFFSVLFLTY
jgi:hypothetical protein